jgi:OOP family OmpA-OmpF porin
MKHRFVISIFAVLLSLPMALAGGYVGVGVGQGDVELDDDDISFKGDDTGWKVFGGYRFIKWFGIEGGYVDLGSAADSFGRFEVEVDPDGFDAFAMGVYPIGPVELFAKAGLILWDVKANIDGPGGFSDSDDDDGTDLAYGVGVAFNIGDKFAVRAEWEMFDIDVDDVSTDVSMISVGAAYRF